MGTSLLAMPWAITMAGLLLGIFSSLILTGIALATAIIILKLHKREEGKAEHVENRGELSEVQCVSFQDLCSEKITEFPQLAIHLTNKWFGALLVISSILAVSGASAVYLMLMTNFTYNTGKVIHGNRLISLELTNPVISTSNSLRWSRRHLARPSARVEYYAHLRGLPP